MLSISRQCELLGLSRASYYYRSERDDRYNQRLMNMIDKPFTRLPFYGVERMTAWLNRQGHSVNVEADTEIDAADGPGSHFYEAAVESVFYQEHKRYPYLLSELIIDRPNQVWCADITYIRMLYGFIYLVAIMDWFSRYILAWETSTTLETAFCVQALEKALRTSKPEVFNTDQGVQFCGLNSSSIFKRRGSGSAWMVVAGSLITSSWNVFGERSSMRKSIFMITRWSRRHETAWQGIFCFTTGRGCIPLWEIELLMRSISSNRSL